MRGVGRGFSVTEVISAVTHAVADALPFAKATGFFFATVVFEDVATVGAGLLRAAGGISWSMAFISCFLGVWIGDASLYAVARFAGRNWFERSALRRFAPGVARSERWFDERGIPILIFSRMVPGARLPTYLAAGFLRVPLRQFLLVTGAASFFWTLIVLFVAKTLGERLVSALDAYQHVGLLLAGAGVAIFIALRLLRRFTVRLNSRRVGEMAERMFRPHRDPLCNLGAQ